MVVGLWVGYLVLQTVDLKAVQKVVRLKLVVQMAEQTVGYWVAQ